MMHESWIVEALGLDAIEAAAREASRRRVGEALERAAGHQISDVQLRFVANSLELRVFDSLDGEPAQLRKAAAEAFQIARVIQLPKEPVQSAEWLVRVGCLGVLGDRGADVRRILLKQGLPQLPLDADEWGTRVWVSILDMWLRLFRKEGWDDLDLVHKRIMTLREDQGVYEPTFLEQAKQRGDSAPAWELVHAYHLAKAGEIIGTYLAQGSSDGRFDIKQQLEAQFDRAIAAAGRGRIVERENITRLLQRTANVLYDNSIWTVTRAVNTRVTKYVESLTTERRKDNQQPIFEMLPPQRQALREQGLLGSGHRSVVVSLPTSSGKTLIAEFRILQALNQFDQERGWVAYVVPTRALVNQIAKTLRNRFGPLGITVEKVSPALEVDGLEAGLLLEQDPQHEFRILITTPEKLDLMLRSGWEDKIGRPLTLVVVDEAHNLGSGPRGLKLELLLATINRECRHAQFLLLTPFIPNVDQIASWLDQDSNHSIELGAEWVPNDRIIAIARPEKGDRPGDFSVRLDPQVTTHNTLYVEDSIALGETRPLGLSWSKVSGSPNQLAAATASLLQQRGPVIVLVNQPRYSWPVAQLLADNASIRQASDPDLMHILRFLLDEMGEDFPLAKLIERGVAVHHSGLSDDARALVEWLMEHGLINVLVATTTIAQGVNFPVSGVIFASHLYPGKYPRFTEPMPPEDFWNIVGRTGRVGQGDLGIVALAAHSEKREAELRTFVGSAVASLNSTLIDMISELENVGELLDLHRLYSRPGWSAFLQYLAHTYAQIGDHERFAMEVEQVLRGTLGFRTLRTRHREAADALVRGVYNYAQRIKGKPLMLVDATGFSWESVSLTLAKLGEEHITSGVWSPALFDSRRADLSRLMGVLLQVPELRDQLREVVGGEQSDGDKLSRIVADWVQGRPLAELAQNYFQKDTKADADPVKVAQDAITACCRNVFGRLTQTASWGLSALQALTMQDDFDKLSPEDQISFRNLPARVYYGVNSDEAIALRLLGVPRLAAPKLAQELQVHATMPLHEVRASLHAADAKTWQAALGESGKSYHRVWTILHDVT